MNDVRQWDIAVSNLPIKEVLKGFCPFDNRNTFDILGMSGESSPFLSFSTVH